MTPNILSSLFGRDQRPASDSLNLSPDELETFLLKLIGDHYEDIESLRAALLDVRRRRPSISADLVRMLKKPGSQARMNAALALGLVGDEDAVPALIKTLDDPDATTRFNAINALGKLKARVAVDPLLGIARRKAYFETTAAINALAEIGDPRPVPFLLALLNDPSLCDAAICALGFLGTLDTVSPITQWLDNPCSSPLSASSTLASIFDRSGKQAKTVKERFLHTLSIDGQARLLAAVPAYSPYIFTSDEGNVTAGLAIILGWLFEAHPEDADIREALIRLLSYAVTFKPASAALAHDDPDILPQLLDGNSGLEIEVREALLRNLVETARQNDLPVLLVALDSPEPSLAALAAEGLANLADPATFDTVLDHLDTHSARVRHALLQAMQSIPHPDKSGRVLELLSAKDPLVREAAIHALCTDPSPEVVRALLAAWNDPAVVVRRALIETLPSFNAPQITTLLGKAMVDPDRTIRASAARSLAHAHTDTALSLLVNALRDPDTEVRLEACRSLASHADPASVPPLSGALDDPAEEVRQAALDALRQIGSPDAIPHVRRLLTSSDPDTRSAAEETLKALTQGKGKSQKPK